MEQFLHILQYIIIGFFSFGIFYILFLSISGLFYKRRKPNKINKSNKIALFIPAYKEDHVIIDVVQKALEQEYSQSEFDVFVIADKLKNNTVEHLRQTRAHIFVLDCFESTKANALNTAFSRIKEGEYDIAIILDADNIMQDGFLERINNEFNSGAIIIQAHRIAKNINTKFAILDAISEEVNNHIFRKGKNQLNLSSSLIGSGMAFPFELIKKWMAKTNSIGEDKEIEFSLLNEGYFVTYLDDLFVFDEKVSSSPAFARQRRRWLAAQLESFSQYFHLSFKYLFNRNKLNFVLKGLETILFPRIFYLMIPLIFTFTNLMISNYQFVVIWVVLFVIISLAIFIAIPRKFYNLKMLNAMLYLPLGFFLMFANLFRLKEALHHFIHTEHKENS